MATILLNNGLCAQIDDTDLPATLPFAWRAQRSQQTAEKWYVYASTKNEKIYLHRFLMKPSPGHHIDHIDGDGLNNRRCNLRLCSAWQNNAAIRQVHANSLGYRGVFFRKDRNKFFGIIRVFRKNVRTRCFDTAIEAAHARDVLALRHYGEFAVLNFPIPSAPQKDAAA